MKSIKLFYSYSHKDEVLRKKLVSHLSILKRAGVVSEWHDRNIEAGDQWADEIEQNLNDADIILLLISANFLSSDYCYSKELKCAIDRHGKGSVTVIPIILRPVDWQGAPFAHLQALPKDAKPVTKWPNQDEAFTNVARGIRLVCERLRSAVPAPTEETKDLPVEKSSNGRESFLDRPNWDRLVKIGDWKLDQEGERIIGGGVHTYLISAEKYGNTTFTIRAELAFANFKQHLTEGFEQMNAGIVLGWKANGQNPIYYNVLITGEKLLLEVIGNKGGEAFRDFSHLSRGVTFFVEESQLYTFCIIVTQQDIDVYIDEIFVTSFSRPVDIEGCVGLRPWRSRMICKQFIVNE